MAFSPSFSVTQNTADLSVLFVTDTSTGADPAISFKQISLRKVDGTYLVPAGTLTTYVQTANSSIGISVLDKDYALMVVVNWCNSAGTILYTASNLYLLKAYAEQYYTQLTEGQAGNPKLVTDGEYMRRKMEFRVYIDSAEQAITQGGDHWSAQACIEKAATYINNQSFFF